MFDAREIRDALCAWYAQNHRNLPFRQNADAYAVWVSEIMAQQTQIAALLPYYERFMWRFPDIFTLAEAPEDDVLRCWQGLGYYSRARNLHKTAKIVCERYGGDLPSDAALLRHLPGIGAYTAGAIASIAYEKPEPAVDGNALRVFARLCAMEQDVKSAEAHGMVTDWIRECMRGAKPSILTQAIMELGALVCLPSSPRCGDCPIEQYCEARRRNMTGEYPIRSAAVEKKTENRAVLILWTGDGRILLRRRSERLLHNLWEFPGFESTDAMVNQLALWRIDLAGEPELVALAKHVFTHLVWQMQGFECRAVNAPEIGDCVWAKADELDHYAIPTAFRTFVRYVGRVKSGEDTL